MSDANAPRIALLGVPIEIGASQLGTLMGPDALRTAGHCSPTLFEPKRTHARTFAIWYYQIWRNGQASTCVAGKCRHPMKVV